MKKIIKKIIKSITVSFLLFLLCLFNGPAPVFATDSFTDSYTVSPDTYIGSSSSDYAVSGGQLKMQAPGGNVAWWKMDETSGISVTDSSVNGNSGTFSNPATGGAITYSGGYTIHTFTTSGTFTPSASMNVKALVVGGGGGGGSGANGNGAGAGGGGVQYSASLAVTAQAYTVTVGGGGAPGTGGGNNSGNNGNNSVFSTLTALGGGGGGGGNTNGVNGGCGGGGGGSGTNSRTGGTGSQGGNGGTNCVTANRYAGGGGGGAGNGGDATSTKSGDGGAGYNSSISGGSLNYAGGGGGGATAATVGAGTDGGGSGSTATATDGTANTGGGGGGGNTGGTGGSGIVIISYPTPSTVVDGEYSKARSFDGSSDYITGPYSFNYTSEPFTISMWINPNLTSNSVLFSNGSYNSSGYYTQFNSSGALFFITNQSGNHQTTSCATGTFTAGSWQHLAITRSGSSVKIYKNGSDVTDSAASHTDPSSTTQPFTLGTYGPSPSGWYYSGLIDDVRIYNYVRSASEITADINNYSYETSATVISNNLLTGKTGVDGIDEFVYNLSSLPGGTTATLWVGQDGSHWHSIQNGVDVQDGAGFTLSQGTNTIVIHPLLFSGSNFYYKVAFTGNGSATPVLDDITLNYTTAGTTTFNTSSWPSCAPLPGKDWTFSNDCFFPKTGQSSIYGNIDGVDNGNITVSKYKTLTVEGDQIIARNNGKGITVNGTIAINDVPINGTGGNVRDYSGNNNEGAAVGSTIVAGKYTNARYFASNSNYVACSDSDCGGTTSPKLDFDASTSFTYEGWFNSSTAQTSRGILGKKSTAAAATAGYTAVISATGIQIICRISDGTNQVSVNMGSGVLDGAWHHIACAIDRGAQTLTAYLDGVASSPTSISAVGSLDNSSDFRVGIFGGGTGGFVGSIDDIRIYRYARSSSQVTEDMNYAPNPTGNPMIAWWRFEDGGQIKETNLWSQDVDGDGWTQTLETQDKAQTNTPGTGWVRRKDTIGSIFGTSKDASTMTFTTNTNLSTWVNTGAGKTCAYAPSYNLTAFGTTSLPNGDTVTTATLSSAPAYSDCLTAGDNVLIINAQGTSSASTNTGNYELLKIYSINGTTVTFTTAKKKNYGSGANDSDMGTGAAQQKVVLQRIPQFQNVTINPSVIINTSTWNGTTGGIVAFQVSGTLTNNGTISASALGYLGGATTLNGESYSGTGAYSRGNDANLTPSPNNGGLTGAGGGGGKGRLDYPNQSKGGGGGGGGYGGGGGGGGGGAWCGTHVCHGTCTAGDGGTTGVGAGGGGGGSDNNGAQGVCGAGGTAPNDGSTATGGTNGVGGAHGSGTTSASGAGSSWGAGGGGGGGTYGATDLSKIFLGSGGGGGGLYGADSVGATGGIGGGVVMIFGNTITNAGSITSTGADGVNGPAGTASGNGGSGGGSGGSILIEGATVTLNSGSGSITANGGAKSTTGTGGGAGGVGRVAVGYVSISGTTTPTYTPITAP